VRDLNRKQRTRMARGKEGLNVTEVLVQEGRVHLRDLGRGRGRTGSLYDRPFRGGWLLPCAQRARRGRESERAGHDLRALAFAESCVSPDHNKAPDAQPNRFYAYGVVGRLALLAAARELASLPAAGAES
jgi:glutamate--cysteine ligase